MNRDPYCTTVPFLWIPLNQSLDSFQGKQSIYFLMEPALGGELYSMYQRKSLFDKNDLWVAQTCSKKTSWKLGTKHCENTTGNMTGIRRLGVITNHYRVESKESFAAWKNMETAVFLWFSHFKPPTQHMVKTAPRFVSLMEHEVSRVVESSRCQFSSIPAPQSLELTIML